MKQRVADYIADFFSSRQFDTVFTVVGGGAMHLNDALGHHEKLHCIYVHHEQAAAMAGEGYARITGKPSVVCVTTGPGGTNALTGVLGAYQDSIPMFVISGQVRLETTVESTGLELRQYGEQEYCIIKSVKPMTKYAKMIKDPYKIRYYLEKAYWNAMEGRKGPVWLDIPLNIQSAFIETENLTGYDPGPSNYQKSNISQIINMLKKAERPVILVGSGIRSSNSLELFQQLVYKWNYPVVAATSIADIMPDNESVYFGNFGTFGGRAGNYIVQNADLLFSLGCRMSFKQIGFNYELFAPNAKKIVVDVDVNELQKETVDIELPIYGNLDKLLPELLEAEVTPIPETSRWLEYCRELKKKYPIYQEKFRVSDAVNQYYFVNELQKMLDKDAVIVAGNSVASVCALQMGIQKEGQRMFGNVNCGSMGWDLPAAVGAAVASGSTVFCLTGDGSIQMNIQELQTIVTNHLPVKIVVFNNGGYQAIVQSQTNFFHRLAGCTKDSGLEIPSFEKIANAYGIPYFKMETHRDVDNKMASFFNIAGYALCEVIQDTQQNIEPRVKSKRLENGDIYSPPIDDLSPFLSEEEKEENRYK